MVVAVWTQAAHTCRVELSRSLLGHGSSDLQRTFSGSSADLQRAFSGPSLDLQPLRADRGPDQLVQQNEIVPTSSLEFSPGTLFPGLCFIKFPDLACRLVGFLHFYFIMSPFVLETSVLGALSLVGFFFLNPAFNSILQLTPLNRI